MPKLVLAAITTICIVTSLPAAAQQSGLSHQSNAGQSVAQDKKGNAHRGNSENSSFKFNSNEIREMQDEIRQAQRALNDKGYNIGKVDGILGHRTAQALRKFQRQQGIPVTGQIDDRTASVLGLPSMGGSHTGQGGSQPSTTGGAASTRHRATPEPML